MTISSRLETPHELPVLDWPPVIDPVVFRDRQRMAGLVVDQDHPFFFDHPVDHVPGMLLLTALIDLVRAGDMPHSAPGAPSRLRLSLNFSKICELSPEVTLLAEPNTAGCHDSWTVRAVQAGSTVCAGAVELSGAAEAARGWFGRQARVSPFAAHMVHRWDPDNVLLGEPVISPERYDVALASLPSGHFLHRQSDGCYGLEEIIEAGRQLVIVANHLAHRRPLGANHLWMSLTADLPVTASRGVPLALRWPVCPPRGNIGRFDMTLVAAGSSHPVGSLSYVTRYCTPAGYRRLREQGLRA